MRARAALAATIDPMVGNGNNSKDAVFRGGRVVLAGPTGWPEGTRLVVTPAENASPRDLSGEHVIIAGFGLAGRCVADLLERASVPYVIIERNPATVETQRGLGRRIVHGDVRDEQTLHKAGIAKATILALTIPNEDHVLEGTSLARRLRPDVYIIARTNYSSTGIEATVRGANDVIKAEQAVALQFYERLKTRIR